MRGCLSAMGTDRCALSPKTLCVDSKVWELSPRLADSEICCHKFLTSKLCYHCHAGRRTGQHPLLSIRGRARTASHGQEQVAG